MSLRFPGRRRICSLALIGALTEPIHIKCSSLYMMLLQLKRFYKAMKNILNTIVLLEIISVMCVRHTASFKNNYRGRPSQNFSILHRKRTMTVRRLTAACRGGRGHPTVSGSGRCLPDTSSRDSEDAGDGRRAECSEAE